MKQFACVGLAAALACTAALSQDRDRVWTAPDLPPREVLDRLNLKLDWAAVVQCEGQRDGVATVQSTGRLLLVQTRSGLVTALDAATGQTRWRTRVGRPYQRPLPLAFNRKAIFVINGTDLFSIDRATGATNWEFSLPDGVSAPPVAGDHQIYVGFGTSRVSAYLLPQSDQSNLTSLSNDAAEYLKGEEEAAGYPPGTVNNQPLLGWTLQTRLRVEYPMLVGIKGVLVTAPEGDLVTIEKFPLATRKATEIFRYRLTDLPIPVAPGQYENEAYVGGQDATVYSANIDTGRIAWRFVAGGPIARQPIPTREDVYVVAHGAGMARLDRATGQPMWRLPRNGVMYTATLDVDRFLAANPKFVYAADASGRLVVLDRATGLRLSTYDGARAFNVPFSNTVNDRLYLTAHSGLVLCLHDNEYTVPYRHARGEELALDPRAAEVEAKLAKPITTSGTEPTTLTVLLKDLLGEKNGNIKFLISENAFKEAGIAGIEERKVFVPAVTKVPLGELLKRVLEQVDSAYKVVEDTVLIYPAAAKKAAP
jgi:outer membrane protein assembly factor BamB